MYSYHRIHILFILKFVHSFHCIHISHNHICIFDSPNPYICIIAHVFPHYQIRISLPHFVCVFLYAGAINRTPTAADGLQQRCEQIAIYTRTPTKCPQNIPQYTHVHPRNTTKHSARRRGRFIAPVSLHKQKCIFPLPNTHFHITKYAFPFHHTHISVCHFVCVYVYAGTINRTPTAADGLQ